MNTQNDAFVKGTSGFKDGSVGRFLLLDAGRQHASSYNGIYLVYSSNAKRSNLSKAPVELLNQTRRIHGAQ